MPKPRGFASLQEELIFKLSASTFGEAMLFQPHLYGMGKEPADIAWVTNRCAVLIYCQQSKGSFLKKRNHNLKQLIRWLKKWRAGEALRGSVKTGRGRPEAEMSTREVSFDFADVDHVIGLSIVDGGEVFCQYHERVCADYIDLKLSACGTLAGSIMRLLADKLANPRTLLYWLRELRDQAGAFPVRSEHLEAEIETKFEVDLLIQQSKFQLPGAASPIGLKSTANHLLSALHFLKSLNVADVASDLTFSDFLWISLAYETMGSIVARALPGQVGPLRAELTRDAEIYLLRATFYATSDHMAADVHPMIARRDKRPGIDVIGFFLFWTPQPDGMQMMLTVTPRQGLSILQTELEAMKAKLTTQHRH